jgi:uncharacterized membrane protein YqiK
MGETPLVVMGIAIAAAVLVLVGVLVLFLRAVVTVEQGQALVVTKPGSDEVRFASGMVLPFIHRGELIDIRTKTLLVERRGKQGVVCRDGIRADVELTAFLRINPTVEDVLKVARALGCARAGDPAVLDALFSAKIADALQTVAAHLDFEPLHRDRDRVKDQLIAIIGTDLSGFVLDDVVLGLIEQTPLELLDPNNVLDAQGIRKITERTAEESVRRNELVQESERRRLVQQLELEELVIELERRKLDALARFREATGRELTNEELRARLEDGLRVMIERVLDERRTAPG